LQPQKKNPLLIYLHGYGENFQRTSVKTKDSLPGCIQEFPILQKFTIVTPFTPQGFWWNTDDLIQFIKRIILIERDIDISRISVCGISMGGYAAWALMSKLPNCFAAVVPVCGGTNPFDRFITIPFRWYEFDKNKFKTNKYTAVWAFHGKLDFVVPVYETTRNIALLQNMGNPKCKQTLFLAGHWIFKKVFSNPELYSWLYTQQLSPIQVRESVFFNLMHTKQSLHEVDTSVEFI
jgi:predicted peptidase